MTSSRQVILNLLREPFFWKIFNAHKEKRFTELWRLFDLYLEKFSAYDSSQWNSEVLGLAERFMIDDDQYRFLSFFKKWNPQNFEESDWAEKEVKGFVLKPLAISCLKKAVDCVKHQNDVSELGWLIDIYRVAVNKVPDDEWIARGLAQLLHIAKDEQGAINIYRDLALVLGKQSYFWSEFADCVQDNRVKIGLLSKALIVGKKEEFLGNIHLELAKRLIDENLHENAWVELEKYKLNRESNGWRLSEEYNGQKKRLQVESPSIKSNNAFYKENSRIGEVFAYEKLVWEPFVLVSRWKNNDGKNLVKLSDGKEKELILHEEKHEELNNARAGEIVEFKLKHHIKEIDEELTELDKWLYSRNHFSNKKKAEHSYEPLLVKTTKKKPWSILKDQIAVIDYINVTKRIIHAVTTKNEEIFFEAEIENFSEGDFISGKKLVTKGKEKNKTELMNINLIDRKEGILAFKEFICVVDSVNEAKSLFHYVVDKNMEGVVHYNETNLRPDEGSFLKIRFYSKKDKKRNKTFHKVLEITKTEESSSKLVKKVNGTLELKYRMHGGTWDFYNMEEEDLKNISPSFGFVSDYYVPSYLLKEKGIIENCKVEAMAVNTGDKWKAFDLVIK